MNELSHNGPEEERPPESEAAAFDIEALKEASKREAARRQAERQKTSDALRAFYRGFAPHEEITPEVEEPAIDLEVGKVSRARDPRKVAPNQDSVLQADDQQLFGVFDGMGGYAYGELASRTAARAIGNYYKKYSKPLASKEEALEQIKAAMQAARDEVLAEGSGGGTTAVFAKIEHIKGKPYLAWANAGDSRLFIQRGMGAPIEAISTDQSLDHLVFNGLYSWHDVSAREEDEFGIIPLEPRDRIMLCSDGITGDTHKDFLSEAEMQWAFSALEAQDAAERLLAASKKRDDKSAIVIDVHDGWETEEIPPEPAEQTHKPTPDIWPPAPYYPPPLHDYPENRRQRVARAFRGAGVAAKTVPIMLAQAMSRRYDRYFYDYYEGKRRRTTAKVVGAVALVAAGLAAYKFGLFNEPHHKGGTVPEIPGTKPPSTTGTETIAPSPKPPSTPPPAGGPKAPSPHNVPNIPEITQAPSLRLSQGGNIWDQSADFLRSHGYQATNADIDTVKDAVLQHQGISEFDATRLPVGYRFTIPLEVLSRIPKG